MKQILPLSLAVALAATPGHGQQTEMSEGFSLLREGSRLMIEGLMKELGPVLLELEGRIIDLHLYHAPEVLPNGDIIIRRRVPIDTPGEGETDL